MTRGSRPLSAGIAVLVGHIVVTAPVLMLIVCSWRISRPYPSGTRIVAILGATVVAWLWWSLAVPRWRIWSLDRGADADTVQRLGVATGLLWPKGWVFEKTELPPRKRD